ncbi:hypothetical protein VCHA50P415_70144 [Vibrio chagasii]|nr:hypothetical protein VCHA31O73_130009 [Vibrio chagasii]CAH6806305.1 hypothetical protein VCHA35O135_120022 [Vibrio chagasii]CAH6809365.1 hypothetical protein VCHA35O143_130010 [Vibrio chagasii]CAH6814021.1 hypothetical protein VCHA34P120_120111 [Vibrio chagasii]CAH6818513.1 hypothetical protein VCHA34P112_150048 [Vibrio chagasii]
MKLTANVLVTALLSALVKDKTNRIGKAQRLRWRVTPRGYYSEERWKES